MAAVLVVLAGPGPAWAHNSLVEAVPAKDAVLRAAPPQVALRFLATLKADGAKLTVTAADGVSAIGPATIDGKTIAAPFTARTGGVYQVGYDVVSTDGHEVKGSYTFTLDLPAASPSTTPIPPASASVLPAVADSPSPVAQQATNPSSGWWPYALGLLAVVLVAGGLFALRRRARP
jgi:copper resistance protein C